MRKKIYVKLFCLVLISGIIIPHLYSAEYDPSLKWRSIQSEHFIVTYPKELSRLADSVARKAEQAHTYLSSYWNWEIDERVNIVIDNSIDMANGYANPFPYKTIKVFPPKPSSSSSIGNYRDWIYELLVHEYTHILQMDVVEGLPATLRSIFGNVIFVNVFAPLWILEGATVFSETKYSHGGRAKSSFTKMLLRTSYNSQAPPSMAQVSNGTIKWPLGMLPYHWGGNFFNYIEEQKGKGTLSEFVHEYGDNFPYFLNHACDDATRNSFPELWDKWRRKLHKDIQRFKQDHPKALMVEDFELWTKKGYFYRNLRILPDQNSILFYHQDVQNDPYIGKINISTGKEKKLVSLETSAPFTISSSGKKLYYAPRRAFNNYQEFSDIKVLNLRNGDTRWVTKKARVRELSISDNGKKIIYTSNNNGKVELRLLNLANNTNRILSTEYNLQAYETPRFSNDNNHFLFTARQDNSPPNIYLSSLENPDKLEKITNSTNTDLHPTWGPQGKSILFASDKNGTYNLYAYHIKRDEYYQLTNLFTGAWSPAYNPRTDSLFFAIYTSEGFNITKKNYSLLEKNAVEFNDIGRNKENFNKNLKKQFKLSDSESYSPLYTLKPRFWLPTTNSNSNIEGFSAGIYTFSEDLLNWHSYSVNLSFCLTEQYVDGRLNYTYSKYFPNFYIDLARKTGADVTSQGTQIFRKNKISGGVDLQWKRIDYEYGSDLHAITEKKNYIEYKFDRREVGLGVDFYYNNLDFYQKSVAPEEGNYLSLSLQRYSSVFGGDYDYNSVQGQVSKYTNISGNFSNRFGISAGKTWGKDSSYFEGGGFGSQPTIWGYRKNSLRGKNFLVGEVSASLPLSYPEFGINMIPLYFDRVWLRFNMSGGSFWRQTSSFQQFKDNFKAGSSIELDSRWKLFYVIPMNFSIGYERAFQKGMEGTFYFDISPSLPPLPGVSNKIRPIN